jgi:membrane-associated phospholipid phosphatase
MRNQWATPFYDKLSKYLSELGDKYIVGVIIFLAYHTLDHGKSFIVMLAAVLCLAFSCVLKSIYHEARPFFLGEFMPNGCRFEYGNPSGHSQIATGLYLTYWEMLCREHKLRTGLKWLSLSALIALAIVLGVSRIYNGVHTYN